jgi:hypothetical protein
VVCANGTARQKGFRVNNSISTSPQKPTNSAATIFDWLLARILVRAALDLDYATELAVARQIAAIQERRATL